MEPSEVLQVALDSGKYLCGVDTGTTNYMCCVLNSLSEISDGDKYRTHVKIQKALGHYAFLRPVLRNRGIIDSTVVYDSPEYKKAATIFWKELIAELKDKGK